MGETDVQRLLFDYGRVCRTRGIDPPYDFIEDERGPRSFTAVADRDKPRVPRYARRRCVAAHAGRPSDRRRSQEPRPIRYRGSSREPRRRARSWRRTPTAGPENNGRRKGWPSRDDRLRGTKLRSLLQRTSPVWNLPSLRRAPEPAKPEVGILEAAPSPKAVTNSASGMSLSGNSASNPGRARTSTTAKRTSASLPSTKPPPCLDAGTPWPESPDGSTPENAWRSRATNATPGIVTVPVSPGPSTRPPPGLCSRSTCRRHRDARSDPRDGQDLPRAVEDIRRDRVHGSHALWPSTRA